MYGRVNCHNLPLNAISSPEETHSTLMIHVQQNNESLKVNSLENIKGIRTGTEPGKLFCTLKTAGFLKTAGELRIAKAPGFNR